MLSCLRSFDLIILGSLLQRMLVQSLVAFDVLFLLLGLSHDLCTALADRWLEPVGVFF